MEVGWKLTPSREFTVILRANFDRRVYSGITGQRRTRVCGTREVVDGEREREASYIFENHDSSSVSHRRRRERREDSVRAL